MIRVPKAVTQRSWGRSRKAVSVLVCPTGGWAQLPPIAGEGWMEGLGRATELMIEGSRENQEPRSYGGHFVMSTNVF